MIITYIVGSFGFWLLCIALLAVWYGVLAAAAIIAICIAFVIFVALLLMSAVRWAVSAPSRAGYFG